MSAGKIILKVGAWLSGFIGLYGLTSVAVLVFGKRVPIQSGSDAITLVLSVNCTLVAFIPFLAFVYPTFQTPRRLLVWSAAVIEILILGAFLWLIFYPRL
jgi:hypothetical protein